MVDLNAYWNLLRESYAKYNAGNYQEVIDLSKKGVNKYPKFKTSIYYTAICAAIKQENIELSLEILKEVINEGGWYSETIFQQTPAFKELENLAEFEKLKKISVDRFKEDLNKDNTKSAIPKIGTKPYPLMLTLHAGGGIMSEEFEIWKEVVNYGFVLGMPRSKNLYWDNDGAYWADFESENKLIQNYIDKLNKNGLLDLDSIILSGLSSGGGLALKLALSGEIATNTFVVVAPGDSNIKEIDEWQPIIDNAKNKNLNGIIIRGEKDTAIPREDTQKLVKMLNDGDISCKFIEYPDLGHWYPLDIIKVAKSLIDTFK